MPLKPACELDIYQMLLDGRKTEMSALPSPSKSKAVRRDVAPACLTETCSPAAVIVPVLSLPELAANEKATVPFPELGPPLLVIVIHELEVVAFHEHPPLVVTVKFPVPAVAGILMLVVETEYGQPLFWTTVNSCPPAKILPVLVLPGLADTEKATVPLPELVLPPPLVIVIQESVVVAVQGQPPFVVTAKLPVPAAAVIFALLGEIEYGQPLF